MVSESGREWHFSGNGSSGTKRGWELHSLPWIPSSFARVGGRIGAMHQGAQKAEHSFSHSCGGSRSTIKVLAGLGFCRLGGTELPQASLLGL